MISSAISRWQAVILFLFLCPLFFQLSGNVFSSAKLIYESYGSISLIPIPAATVFCFVSIAVFLRLENSYFGMGIVFSIFVLMLLSTVISGDGQGKTELYKFVLLVQFVLPMFALIMGGLYLRPVSTYICFEAVVLYMLLLIIPAEVVSTFVQGTGYLTPYLYAFSLYQHLQYLPAIFVGLYFIAAASLYDKKRLRYLVLFLAPWVGIYIAASLSLPAVVMAVLGSVFMTMEGCKNKEWKNAVLVVFFALTSLMLYLPMMERLAGYAADGVPKFHLKTEDILKNSSQDKSAVDLITFAKEEGLVEGGYRKQIAHFWIVSLQQKFRDWAYYGAGVFESPKVFLFGHQSRPDRRLHPSASNYYLDLLYNFGAVSLLPFLYLIFATLRKCWKAHKVKQMKPSLLMLMMVVFFFILIDNFLHMSFRQPYSGMIIFFLWGLLLSEISNIKGDYE